MSTSAAAAVGVCLFVSKCESVYSILDLHPIANLLCERVPESNVWVCVYIIRVVIY